MYRIWIGLDPKIVMSLTGTAISVMVLVLHVWAFNQFNWPASLKAKYATAATR